IRRLNKGVRPQTPLLRAGAGFESGNPYLFTCGQPILRLEDETLRSASDFSLRTNQLLGLAASSLTSRTNLRPRFESDESVATTDGQHRPCPRACCPESAFHRSPRRLGRGAEGPRRSLRPLDPPGRGAATPVRLRRQ